MREGEAGKAEEDGGAGVMKMKVRPIVYVRGGGARKSCRWRDCQD